MDAMDDNIWIWLYVPLFLLGLCTCLHFRYFTKKNILAWLLTITFGQILCCGILKVLHLSPGYYYFERSVPYCIVFALITIVFMATWFFGIKKHAPFKEFFCFTLFTATSFTIANPLGLFLIFPLVS